MPLLTEGFVRKFWVRRQEFCDECLIRYLICDKVKVIPTRSPSMFHVEVVAICPRRLVRVLAQHRSTVPSHSDNSPKQHDASFNSRPV